MSAKSNEAALVERAINKDKKALAELCSLKGKQVLFTCLRILGNYHDAEDAAQEVILKMYKNIKGLKSAEAFNSWLQRLTTNVCTDIGIKTMKRREYVNIEDVFDDFTSDEDLDTIPAEYVETEENKRRVIECIDRLPTQYARSIQMFYYDGMSYMEIAEALEVTPNAVRMYIHKGKKRLKDELVDEFRETKLSSYTPALALGPVISSLTAQSIESVISNEMLHVLLKNTGLLIFSGIGKVISVLGATVSGVAITAITISVIGYGVKEVSDAQSYDPPPPSSITESTDADSSLDLQDDPSSMGGNGIYNDQGEILAHSITGRIFMKRPADADINSRNGLSDIQVEIVDSETGKPAETSKSLSGVENGIFQVYTFENGQYKVRITFPELITPIADNKWLVEDEKSENVYWLVNGDSEEYEFTEDSWFLLKDVDIEVQIESSISGEITFLNKSGATISNIGNYLPDVSVILIDPQNRIVGSEPLKKDGSFLFENPMITQSGEYTLRYSLGDFNGISQQILEQKINLSPGQDMEVDNVEIKDTFPPAISLDFMGGDCDCGHINPSGIKVDTYDMTGSKMHWELRNTDAHSEVSRGYSVAELNLTLKSLPNGSYTLTIFAEDAAGNSSNYIQELMIKK